MTSFSHREKMQSQRKLMLASAEVLSVLCAILVSFRSLLSYSRSWLLKGWVENIYIWSAHSDFWSTLAGCHNCRYSQAAILKDSLHLSRRLVFLLSLNYNLTPVSTVIIEFQPLLAYAICHRAPWNMGRGWDNWVCSVWRRKFYRGLNCCLHCQMRVRGENGAKTPPCVESRE